MTKPILFTTLTAAIYLSVTRRQVQRLAKAGVLPVHHYGPRGVEYFRKSDLNNSPTSLA